MLLLPLRWGDPHGGPWATSLGRGARISGGGHPLPAPRCTAIDLHVD